MKYLTFNYLNFLHCSLLSIIFLNSQSDTKAQTDTVNYLTLDQCIVYAMQHQPAIMQSSLAILIAKKTNAISLSSWLPQVNLTGNFTHYFQLPTNFSVNFINPEAPIRSYHNYQQLNYY